MKYILFAAWALFFSALAVAWLIVENE